MKFIIIFSLIMFACSSNKQLQFDKSSCNFNDKIIEDEKALDFELVKKDFNEDCYYVYKDNDTIHYSLEYGISENYWKRKENKITNIEKIIAYDRVSLKAKNSFSFYNKGNFNIGNEYIYNDKGEVIKTIDHNQYNKYPICYKEIIKNTIKKAGRKFYFQGLERDSLIVDNQTEYSWKVYFEDSISKSPTLSHKFFRINAKSGKTITEKIVN